MRAAGAAGLGAGAQGLVNDRLDGAGAAAAFGAAAEAAIDLFGMTGHASADRVADIVVTQDVAGTDDHRKVAGPSVMLAFFDIG